VQDFAGLSFGNTAVINLTVERSEKVFRILTDAGYRVVASEHLLLRLDKRPGALAELSRRLARENVNVRGMHIVNKDEATGIVALETVDHERAREILQDILVG
jgi:histidine decarboxylase